MFMCLKGGLVKEKTYRYAAVSIHLPDGKVRVLERKLSQLCFHFCLLPGMWFFFFSALVSVRANE